MASWGGGQPPAPPPRRLPTAPSAGPREESYRKVSQPGHPQRLPGGGPSARALSCPPALMTEVMPLPPPEQNGSAAQSGKTSETTATQSPWPLREPWRPLGGRWPQEEPGWAWSTLLSGMAGAGPAAREAAGAGAGPAPVLAGGGARGLHAPLCSTAHSGRTWPPLPRTPRSGRSLPTPGGDGALSPSEAHTLMAKTLPFVTGAFTCTSETWARSGRCFNESLVQRVAARRLAPPRTRSPSGEQQRGQGPRPGLGPQGQGPLCAHLSFLTSGADVTSARVLFVLMGVGRKFFTPEEKQQTHSCTLQFFIFPNGPLSPVGGWGLATGLSP